MAGPACSVRSAMALPVTSSNRLPYLPAPCPCSWRFPEWFSHVSHEESA